eukprot:c23062_g1_i1 orf=1513-2601(+)
MVPELASGPFSGGSMHGTSDSKPSLLDLCLAQVVADVYQFAEHLPLLPLELAHAVVRKIRKRTPSPYLHELVVLCEAFWRPTTLSLRGISNLSCHGLQYLPYAAISLTKLDLCGCSWLDSLSFLPALIQLECLNLRDCWRLPGSCLGLIQKLPLLQCLDVENVYSITDALASYFIPGMKALRALNISGTSVGDGFMEAVTYGWRLRSWVSDRQSSSSTSGIGKPDYKVKSISGATDSGTVSEVPLKDALYQWPVLELKYLRLQRTKISEASVPFILAKYGLISLPNNSKMLARSNSILNATLHGACGCISMATRSFGSSDTSKEKPDWLAQWEQDGVISLLKGASRLKKRFLVTGTPLIEHG